MKYNILFSCLILFFISTAGFGQTKQFRYYFDRDFNAAEKSKAVFSGIGMYENGVLELKLYNVSTNSLVLIEHCTDSSLQVNNGFYQAFYPNAVIDSEGNYLNGKKQGLWMMRDTLGRTIDSTVYDNDSKIMQAYTGYHKNGRLAGFTVNDIKSDHIKRTNYNDSGQLRLEADFTGAKGIVKRYESALKVKIDTVFSRMEIEASFPGGEAAWTQYVTKQLQKDIDALTRDGISGTCRIKFIVDKEGNVTQAEALTMKGTRLARMMVNAVSKGPKWIPAMQYGRPVNAFREQPVTFTVQGN